MNKTLFQTVFSLLIILITFLPNISLSVETNLILNSGFENSATSGIPLNWSKVYWGSPAPKFKYPDVGRNGTDKSSTVVFSKNSTGDARWSPDAVNVTPGTSYVYNSWYKTNTVTQINAEYVSSTGIITYVFVMSLPSSNNTWKLASTTIKIPEGVIKAKFFHLISKKGSLTVDDFSVVEIKSTTTTPPIPTLTLEALPLSVNLGSSTTLSWSATNISSCSASLGWFGLKSATGTEVFYPATTTTFDLGCSGTSGSIQKQVTVTVLEPMLVPTSTPPISTTTPPIGTSTPVVWNEGVVAISFDDAWASQYTNAIPILESAGIKGTFYITTEPIVSDWSGFMTPTQVKNISDSGHEIGGHTVTHPHLKNMSQVNLVKELQDSKAYLENLTGKKVDSFAYPYGEWNSMVKTEVINAGYKTGRGVEEEILNSSTTDRYNLRSPCLLKNHNINTIIDSINMAKNNKELYIVCLHEIKEGGDEYSITPTQFSEIINQIKISGIKTMTVRDATNFLYGIK